MDNFEPVSLLHLCSTILMTKVGGKANLKQGRLKISPKRSLKSRLNQCTLQILWGQKRVKTRCVMCNIPDGVIIDCDHFPCWHPKTVNISPNYFNISTQCYTPIICTDGTVRNFPADHFHQYVFFGMTLRETIRNLHKLILTQSFFPPPIFIISAGNSDLSINSPGLRETIAHSGNYTDFVTKFLKDFVVFRNLVQFLGGDAILCSLIPRIGEQISTAGISQRAPLGYNKQSLRDLFRKVNKAIMQLGKPQINLTKYFEKRVTPRNRKPAFKPTKSHRHLKVKVYKSETMRWDGHTPTDETLEHLSYAIYANAKDLAGLGHISRDEFTLIQSRSPRWETQTQRTFT